MERTKLERENCDLRREEEGHYFLPADAMPIAISIRIVTAFSIEK